MVIGNNDLVIPNNNIAIANNDIVILNNNLVISTNYYHKYSVVLLQTNLQLAIPHWNSPKSCFQTLPTEKPQQRWKYSSQTEALSQKVYV